MGVVALLAVACSDDEAATDGVATSSMSSTSASSGAGGSGAGGAGGAPSCDGSHTDSPEGAAAYATLRQFIDENDIPGGGAIAIVKDGQTRGLAVYGTKRGPGCDPITEETLMRATKGTEIITALAALDAVEDGSLSLVDPIKSVVPTLHTQNDDASTSLITLHHLLTETSGYRAISDQWFMFNTCTTLEDSVTNAEIPLQYFPPGTLQQPGTWSNSEIVGLALQNVDGVPFQDSVRARVLDPLGMGGAFTQEAIEAVDYAMGHFTATPVPLEICENRFPSDGYYGSIQDMARLFEYVTGGAGALLEPAMLEAMLSEQAPHFWSSDYMPYGFDDAWHIAGVQDDVLLIDSFRYGNYSSAWLFRQRNLAVVIMLNSSFLEGPGAIDLDSYNAFMNSVLVASDPALDSVATIPEVIAEPAALAAAMGTYVDPIGFNAEGERTMVVSASSDPQKLTAVVTDGNGDAQTYELSPFLAPDSYKFGNATFDQTGRFWRERGAAAFAISFGNDGGPPFYRVEPTP